MSKYKNELQIYRRRMRFSQKQASMILGYGVRSKLSRLEAGRRLPDLETALPLEILYRVPIAFCYPRLYQELRNSLRLAERAVLGLNTTGKPAHL
jgi:transcriptional regulator with XRE-family HTH domain